MGRLVPGPTGDLGELFDAVSRRVRHELRRDLGPLGVTPAQMRALRTLSGRGEPMRMSDLADALRIARRSATSIVDELVNKRLVTRNGDARDRRAVVVQVSAAGEELLSRVSAQRRVAAERVLGGLDPADRDELARLLAQVAGRA